MHFNKWSNFNILKYLMRVPVFLVVLALGACCSLPQNEGSPAQVADVVGKIKADLKVYQAYDAAAASVVPLDNACQASVGFYIDNVKVSLTTQTDVTTSGTASATLPVGSGTFGPSLTLGASQETKGTQTLTFTLYPKVVPAFNAKQVVPKAIDANLYPIAASLQSLRNGLLEASQKEPCISLTPISGLDGKQATADPGGTYAFGFTVINNASAGGTLKFVVFSLGATNTVQRQAGNTITVTFKARPGNAAAFE